MTRLLRMRYVLAIAVVATLAFSGQALAADDDNGLVGRDSGATQNQSTDDTLRLDTRDAAQRGDSGETAGAARERGDDRGDDRVRRDVAQRSDRESRDPSLQSADADNKWWWWCALSLRHAGGSP